ncbi:amino acid permease-domain-containing protein [Mycena galopus ATCC 62051]|nr:amino acid permease-domain-containing protein [Mycena galopus ATCC 62051]
MHAHRISELLSTRSAAQTLLTFSRLLDRHRDNQHAEGISTRGRWPCSQVSRAPTSSATVKYWMLDEAPFVGNFGGFASLFVTASFAYGGTESIGIIAGGQCNPTRNVPRVINRVFFCILIFYILTVILIGFDIPYNFPNLSTKTSATSPFTLVFTEAGSKAGGSFMNVVILTSV